MPLILHPDLPDVQQPAYDYTVDLEGETYRIQLQYMERQDGWYLSISDSDGNRLMMGKRLSVNTALINGLQIAGLPPGDFLLLDLSGSGVECSFEDLGRRCSFGYALESEIPAAAGGFPVTITIP